MMRIVLRRAGWGHFTRLRLQFGHADRFEVRRSEEYFPAPQLSVYALYDQDLLIVIDFAQFDLNNFAAAGLNRSSYERRLNRKLTMPAINQRKQLYPPRASMIEKRIERGAHGASCVENIIDKNDVPSVYIETQVAGVEDWANIFCRKVIPVKADVQHAHIDWLLLDAANQRRQSSGQRNAAPLHAYQAEVVGAIILFDNLVGKPDQRPLNL